MSDRKPIMISLSVYEALAAGTALRQYASKLEREARKSTFVPEPGKLNANVVKAETARQLAKRIQKEMG